jgi:adenylate cyclase
VEAARLERKLVAILAADVVGYSAHMERDEAATLEALTRHRGIVDALIGRHGGTIIGTAGDSVLAEFASVVDAVDCATKIQQAIAEANTREAEDRRLVFRIGINVGDVMVKGGDIYGDSVNIAARLESMAEPGGICVSRSVRDHLRNKGVVVFEDMGEHSVKNIAQPVRAFRVRFDSPVEASDELAPQPAPVVISTNPATAPAKEDKVAVEVAFWDTVKDSTDEGELEAYLEQYPGGSFIELAKARLQGLREKPREPGHTLKAEQQPEHVAVELAFWETVTKDDTPAMYEAYLGKYPQGEFVPLAKVRLEELKSGAAPGSKTGK